MTATPASRPRLLVVAGPNGAGKTTITERGLAHEWFHDCEYVNPDAIAQDELGDWNDPATVLRAAQLATERREACLREGRSLAFETVFSAADKPDFVRRAMALGYFVRDTRRGQRPFRCQLRRGWRKKRPLVRGATWARVAGSTARRQYWFVTYLDRIVRDPAICAGQPVIRGTRVLVRVVLGYLAHGETTAHILKEFPTLAEEDVRAVIAFAAASGGEDLPAPSPIPPNAQLA